MKKKKIYSMKNVLKGCDFYDENGQLVNCSVPEIGGGDDFYGANEETGYFVDSVIGGRNLYGSEGQRVFTVPSALGGEDIHGDVNGFCLDSLLGGEDIFIDEG